MSRPRLLVATSFGIFPPQGGGQARVFGLYRALAALGVDVEVVALVDRRERPRSRAIAPGLRETRVPKSAAHESAEAAMVARAGVPVTDLALAAHHDLTPSYGEALAAAADGAAAAVASHPFSGPALREHVALPLIYEAHNVELDLKAPMLGDAEELLDVVREAEAQCCREAAHVIVCSAQDAARLGELYGLGRERTVLVPNGVDPAAVPFTPLAERRRRQEALGMAGRRHAAFVGSWHEPNLVAVRDVLAAAQALPEVRFLVAGSAGLPFAAEPVPGNVDLCGIVTGRFIRDMLAVVDAALNPMRWGSGTNLKMLDYALAGAPVLSSEFGARGLGLTAGRDYAATDPDTVAAGLERLLAEPDETLAARVASAREQVETEFSWSAIAARWKAEERFAELLDGAVAAR